MDTKLTKFNSRFIIKAVSVILILLTVFVSSKVILSDVIDICNTDNDYDDYYFSDAIFNKDIAGIYYSEDFTNYIRTYLSRLSLYSYVFGDESKDRFNEIVANNEEEYSKYKENFLEKICEWVIEGEKGDPDGSYYEYEYYYCKIASLVSGGIIDLTLINKLDSTDVIGYSCDDLFDTDIGSDIYSVCIRPSLDDKQRTKYFNPSKEKAKLYGGDLYISLPEIRLYGVADLENIASGEYVLKVNDQKLKSALIEDDNLNRIALYDDYDTAKKSLALDPDYKNINYIIETNDGKVLTNVENYKEGKENYNKYSYYITGTSHAFKSNYGTIYTLSEFDKDFLYYLVDVYNNDAVEHTVVTGTTQTTTHVSTGDSTGESENTVVKRVNSDSYGEIVPSNIKNLYVYFNDDASFANHEVGKMKEIYYTAGKTMREIVFVGAVAVLLCLALFILLIILSGKRSSNDEEIHLLATDKIFFEIRLTIELGVIVAFALMYSYIFSRYSNYNSNTISFIISTIPFAITLCAGLLLDFTLYITRLLKAKRFMNSCLIWRLIKLLFGFVFKVLKKLFHILLTPFKALVGLIKDVYKAKKANSIKGSVIVKSVILACIDITLLLAIIFFAGLHNFFTVFVLVCVTILLNGYMILRSVKFVGGVDRILEVLHAYRQGKLDTYINRAALPDYLMSAAEDLEELGDGIKLAVDEAVKQENTKTELITNISHDLKTPLTSIINYVELLKQCDIQNETAQSYLEVLGEKSDRLKHLICDLVEASKAATGNVEVTMVDVSLNEVLAQIVGEHNDTFMKKGLQIVCDIPENDIIVKADSKLLYRVMENLAINVEKYAMPSTRVYISAEETPLEGSIVIKNISANPLNITPEQLKQRFVRGDSARTTEGSGLGLSIAENLCVAQQGKLDIDISGDLFVAKVEMKK